MQKYKNDIIKSLQTLISHNSVEGPALENMPFGQNVASTLEFVLGLCKSLGFRTKNVDGFCGYAEIGEGKLFGILTHLDTVPFGDGWRFPPLSGHIEDGLLYGRGAMDNKGPAISCIYALKALVDSGKTPKMRVRLIFGLDEESGWKCMEHYLKTEEVPEMGFAPDSDFPVINAEKGIVYYELSFDKPDGVVEIVGGDRPNMVCDFVACKFAFALSQDDLKLAESCGLKLAPATDATFIAKGKSAHGSHPEQGDNAIWKLFEFLSDFCGGEFKNLYNNFCTLNMQNAKMDFCDEVSGKLTTNLGTIRTVANTIVCSIDIRYPISKTESDVFAALNVATTATLNKTMYHNALYVDANHPLVTTLLGAYKKVTGLDGKPKAIGGGTYARALPVAVAFGPQFENTVATIHQPNEYIAIADLLLMTEIYKQAIFDLCF